LDTIRLSSERGGGRANLADKITADTNGAVDESLQFGEPSAGAQIQEAQPERRYAKSKGAAESDELPRGDVKSDRAGKDISAEVSQPQKISEPQNKILSKQAAEPAKPSRVAESLEGYLVEASPQQIEATLKGLEANKKLYWSFQVSQPASSDDDYFMRYSDPEGAKQSGELESSGGKPRSSIAPPAKKLGEQSENGRIITGFTDEPVAKDKKEVVADSERDEVKRDRKSETSYEYRGSQRQSAEGEAGFGANAQRVRIEMNQPTSPSSTSADFGREGRGIQEEQDFSKRRAEDAQSVAKKEAKSLANSTPASQSQLTNQKSIESAPSPPAPATAKPADTRTSQSTEFYDAQPQGGIAGKEQPKMRVLFLFRVVPSSGESR
jgi:hypothetical protein